MSLIPLTLVCTECGGGCFESYGPQGWRCIYCKGEHADIRPMPPSPDSRGSGDT